MAMIQFRGSVPPLNNAKRVTIAMPDLLPADGRLWRVLWLLGDEGEMSDALSRKLDTEALSRRTGCAVVMPEGLHSDYENMQRGLRWYDYITGKGGQFSVRHRHGRARRFPHSHEGARLRGGLRLLRRGLRRAERR